MSHYGIIVWQRWQPTYRGAPVCLGWAVDTRDLSMRRRNYRTAYGAAMAARARGLR